MGGVLSAGIEGKKDTEGKVIVRIRYEGDMVGVRDLVDAVRLATGYHVKVVAAKGKGHQRYFLIFQHDD